MSTKTDFILFTTFIAFFLTAFASSGPVSSPAPSPESFFSPSPTGGTGSPAAYPPVDDCLTILYSMYDCESYVIAGSNLTRPDKACCPELEHVVAKNVLCLCKLFGNTTDTLGITVDISRATKLPSLCNVSTPDPNLCAVLNGPQSPSPAPGARPPAGAASEGGFAGASPTAGNSKSGAIGVSSSASASLVGFAITLFSTFFCI